jgi:hypothetical protein
MISRPPHNVRNLIQPMTHIGKIARLPKPIRDELNQRLANGEPGDTLLAWLNALPEVQAVARQLWNGAVVTKQNLSQWRRGAHQDWLRAQDATDRLARLAETFTPADISALGGHAQALLTLHLAELSALPAEDPARRWTLLQPCLAELSRLRRDDLQVARHELNREQWAVKSERIAAEAQAEAARPPKRRERVLDLQPIGLADEDEVVEAAGEEEGAASGEPGTPHPMFGR